MLISESMGSSTCLRRLQHCRSCLVRGLLHALSHPELEADKVRHTVSVINLFSFPASDEGVTSTNLVKDGASKLRHPSFTGITNW